MFKCRSATLQSCTKTQPKPPQSSPTTLFARATESRSLDIPSPPPPDSHRPRTPRNHQSANAAAGTDHRAGLKRAEMCFPQLRGPAIQGADGRRVGFCSDLSPVFSLCCGVSCLLACLFSWGQSPDGLRPRPQDLI